MFFFYDFKNKVLDIIVFVENYNLNKGQAQSNIYSLENVNHLINIITCRVGQITSKWHSACNLQFIGCTCIW